MDGQNIWALQTKWQTNRKNELGDLLSICWIFNNGTILICIICYMPGIEPTFGIRDWHNQVCETWQGLHLQPDHEGCWQHHEGQHQYSQVKICFILLLVTSSAAITRKEIYEYLNWVDLQKINLTFSHLVSQSINCRISATLLIKMLRLSK